MQKAKLKIGNKKKIKLRASFGFTLVEALVYIGIFTILFLAVTNAFIVVSKSYNEVINEQSVAESILSVYDRIGREIRNATSIDTADSVLNVSPGTLAIFVGSGSSKITRKFYISDGAVAVSDNGVFQGDLTSPVASTTNLLFRLITAGETQAVRVEMTIAPVSSSTESENVQDTFVVRSTYEQ